MNNSVSCPKCGQQMTQPMIYKPWELYAWCRCGFSYERKPKTELDFIIERSNFYEAIKNIGLTRKQIDNLYHMFCETQE